METQKVKITKINTFIGYSYGFGVVVGDARGVYIPGSVISAMDWTEENQGDAFTMQLQPNKNDPKDNTPLFVTSVSREQVADDERDDELIYWKLRALRPWGDGPVEAVRLAVAPYGDRDENDPTPLAMIEQEMERNGYIVGSTGYIVSSMVLSGLLWDMGDVRYQPSDAGVKLMQAALEASDDL